MSCKALAAVSEPRGGGRGEEPTGVRKKEGRKVRAAEQDLSVNPALSCSSGVWPRPLHLSKSSV